MKSTNKRLILCPQSTKRVGVIVMFILFSVFFIGMISSLEWDNKLTYSNDDLTINLINWFGFGTDYGSAELKSHSFVNEVLQFGYGKEEVVIYYDFNFIELYVDGLGEVEFINMKTGKQIQKDYSFVEWVVENVEVNDYLEVCDLSVNGTYQCYQEVSGTHLEEKGSWVKYDSRDIPNRKIRIGLKTYVDDGDWIDGIWTIAGKKIKKHSEWTSGLNVGLEFYHAFENSGTDNLSINDLTLTQAKFNFTAGKIGQGIAIDNTSVIISSPFTFDWSGESWTLSGWANQHSTARGGIFTNQFDSTAGEYFTLGTFTSTLKVEHDSLNILNPATDVSDNVWRYYNLVYDQPTTNLSLYVDSVLVESTTAHADFGGIVNSLFFGTWGASLSQTWNGFLDEFGMWSRTLSQAEITQLYNGGTGITFQQPAQAPTVNLISPVNISNFSTQTVDFNCNATSEFGMKNITLQIDGINNFTNSTPYFSFDGDDDKVVILDDDSLDFGIGNFTISTWMKTDSSDRQAIVSKYSGSNPRWFITKETNGRLEFNINDGSTSIDAISNSNDWDNGNWQHLVVVVERGVGVTIYKDGGLDKLVLSTDAQLTINNNGDFVIGVRASILFFNGSIDEVRIYNKSLSQAEVTSLFNQGREEILGSVALDELVSYWDLGKNNATDIKGSNDGTNNGATPTIKLTRQVTGLIDGDHNWTCEAFDSSNFNGTTAIRTFSIDTINPILEILAPPTTVTFHEINTNLFVNWSINDSSLDTCILEYESSNTTLTCSDNSTTINITTILNRTIIIYANDTSGNMNSTSRSWNYKIFQHSITFNNETIGGSTEDFTLNITKDSSLQISTVNLVYNLSSSSASFTSGDTSIITKSLIVPNPSVDTNFSFFFSFLMSDSSTINTSSRNQTVLSFGFDDCSAFTTLIYNFTLLDEENQTELSNVTIDYAFNLFDESRTIQITNFSTSSTVNPTPICMNQNLTTQSFSLDGVLKYVSINGSYLTRYYNILNFTLSSSTLTQNISLYDVLDTTATPFQLTFRDSFLVLAPNILVNVNKQFVSSNDFKTVEIPITDSNGQTILNLVRNIGIYNLIFIDVSGNIVATFNKINAFCQDFTIGECTLNLDAPSSAEETFNFTESSEVFFSLEYVNSTSTATLTFNSINSTPVTVRIVGKSQNQFGNQSVCDNSLTSTLGTISCNTSSILPTDNFLFIDIFTNGNYVATRVININIENQGVGGFFGKDGYFIAFFMLLLIILMFSDDKQTLLIMLGMGWATILVLGLVRGTIIGSISGGIWLIVSIVTMLWKLKQEEVGV